MSTQTRPRLSTPTILQILLALALLIVAVLQWMR